jgi:hypothetical protein
MKGNELRRTCKVSALNAPTRDRGKVRLGDSMAPSFGTTKKLGESGKLPKDPATRDNGKVRVGDSATPSFGGTKR